MMCRRTAIWVTVVSLSVVGARAQRGMEGSEGLRYHFSRGYGQVEVGGVYAGVEFHKSRPLPSRISFYYPVANSIDLSSDYWKRDESRPMVVGVRIDEGPKRWLGKEAWQYTVSPHTVRFERAEGPITYAMEYQFCMNESAFVWRIVLLNTSSRRVSAEVYTHIRTVLRTCQTYARMDSAWTEFDSVRHALITHHDEPETGRACIAVQNVGREPREWTSSAVGLGIADSGWSNWLSSTMRARTALPRSAKGSPVAAFVYDTAILPHDSLVIIQVISSLKQEDLPGVTHRLMSNWRNEVEDYDRFVRTRASGVSSIVTGIASIDRTAVWCRGILAANAHFIDGTIEPMPCPAEYNFFFTHDVLLTSLAAVSFDLPRVKRDLLYIASHAKDNIIPHAYYWRDDGYKTEYCTPDNWNHLWFVIVSASYLRHSMDDSTVRALYPLVTKSLEEILQQRKADNLMYAFRPDWWDIGRNEGPRAYITLLTIRALRDYVFLCSALGKKNTALPGYEALAGRMRTALEDRLWYRDKNYLMNFNGPAKDDHYYMGSLLGAAFRVLSPDKAARLVSTAQRQLLDPRIGIRNVMPPDFHLDSVRAFFKFAGNEAGDPYTYANGGVWAHGNAWYALALAAVGKPDEALTFFETVMTVDGVLRSPRGLPALAEYRYANPSSPEFGAIDKPSFLWAGGFSLYTLYRLLGMDENEWNISVLGSTPRALHDTHFSYAFGDPKQVAMHRHGSALSVFKADKSPIPSAVLPLSAARSKRWSIDVGSYATPYLETVNAILDSATFSSGARTLIFGLSSFEGHDIELHVIAGARPKRVSISGHPANDISSDPLGGGMTRLKVRFKGTDASQKVEIQF